MYIPRRDIIRYVYMRVVPNVGAYKNPLCGAAPHFSHSFPLGTPDILVWILLYRQMILYKYDIALITCAERFARAVLPGSVGRRSWESSAVKWILLACLLTHIRNFNINKFPLQFLKYVYSRSTTFSFPAISRSAIICALNAL